MMGVLHWRFRGRRTVPGRGRRRTSGATSTRERQGAETGLMLPMIPRRARVIDAPL
jgi:hypothetical protein